MKAIFALAVLAPVVGLTGCDINASAPVAVTDVTSAICADAAQVSGSGLALNKNEQLALTGVLNGCAATAQGTVINNGTAVATLIADGIALQQSGLLTNIKAEATPAQMRHLNTFRHDTKRLEIVLGR